MQRSVIPLRLLDCFGFVAASVFGTAVLRALVVVDSRLAAAVLVAVLGTSEVGPFKKADGEGILIVAIYDVQLLYPVPEEWR